MDAATHYEEKRKPLTVEQWAKSNPYMKRLLAMSKKKRDQVSSGIKNYGNRIMPRLQYDSALFKIKDSLAEIAMYASSIPSFIKKTLLGAEGAVPPFQFELVIAVRESEGVKDEGGDDSDDDDEEDDDDDDEEKKENAKSSDPSCDQIGDVQQMFPQKWVPCKAGALQGQDTEQDNPISRGLGIRYIDFREILSNGGDGNDDEAKDESDKDEKSTFNASTYPHGRRFSIFIDRRKKKSSDNDKDGEDEEDGERLTYYTRTGFDKDLKADRMTFYEPSANVFPKGHVPEIGFQFVRQCVAPPERTSRIEEMIEYVEELDWRDKDLQLNVIIVVSLVTMVIACKNCGLKNAVMTLFALSIFGGMLPSMVALLTGVPGGAGTDHRRRPRKS